MKIPLPLMGLVSSVRHDPFLCLVLLGWQLALLTR